MKKILAYLPLLVTILVGFVGTFDLWHVGFPLTHDGDVHLVRLTNFYQVLSEGIWIPRWAPNVNWGYGQPVFEFFYPLPSYIASLLHGIGMSFADSVKLLLSLSIILSGLTMFLWLKDFTSRWSAFFGAFLYMFAPFRFVDVYVRGDIGESLALVFVPVVLLFVNMSMKKDLLAGRQESKYPVLLGGIFLACLILCHNIVSLMTLPFILFYSLYLWVHNGRRKEDILKFLFIICSGFLLSAFFWLPGLLEGKYTLRDIVTKGEYKNRFVDILALFYGPWSYGGSGSFTVQLGIVQWVVAAASLSLVFLKKYSHRILVVALLSYTALAIFLMLPISGIVWSKIILLQNFQFPWRFLLVTIFTTSILGALLVNNFPRKFQLVSIIFLIVICLSAEYTYWHAKAYVARPDSTFAGIFKGPSDTGESSPRWGIRFMESGYTAPLEILDGKGHIEVKRRTSAEHDYIVTADTPVQLMENTLYFPGWHIMTNGKEVPVEFQDEQHRGLMIFSLPAGIYNVHVIFTETKFRQLADVISLFSIIMMIVLLIPLPKRFTIPL